MLLLVWRQGLLVEVAVEQKPRLLGFLQRFALQEDLEFNINTSDASTGAWPGVPPKGEARCVIDDGCIWLEPLL
eukprot:11861751-Prorocentrum_lima.AAC.1